MKLCNCKKKLLNVAFFLFVCKGVGGTETDFVLFIVSRLWIMCDVSAQGHVYIEFGVRIFQSSLQH